MALEISRLPSHRPGALVDSNRPDIVGRTREVILAGAQHQGEQSKPYQPVGIFDRKIGVPQGGITINPDLNGAIRFGNERLDNQEPFGAAHSVRLGIEGGYSLNPPITRTDLVDQRTRPQVSTVDIKA